MRLRTSLLLVLTMLGALVLVPFAATSSAEAYPITICSTLGISTTQPTAGEPVTVSGTHFRPGASVRLVLSVGHRYLTTATADANGSFAISVVLPTDIRGAYLILAVTGAVNGKSCPVDPAEAIGVKGVSAHRGGGGGATTNGSGSTTGSGGNLSFTGVDILAMVALAVALIVSGAALNRRRRPSARTARSSSR